MVVAIPVQLRQGYTYIYIYIYTYTHANVCTSMPIQWEVLTPKIPEKKRGLEALTYVFVHSWEGLDLQDVLGLHLLFLHVGGPRIKNQERFH